MIKEDLLRNTSIRNLSKISSSSIKRFLKAGLKNYNDLILYFPDRYEDRTKILSIRESCLGKLVTIFGKITHSEVIFRNRKELVCAVSDKEEILIIRFFHFSNYLKRFLSVGKKILVYGRIQFGYYGKEMIHPEYSVLEDGKVKNISSRLTPIYSTFFGEKQKVIRDAIDQAIKFMRSKSVPELLPPFLARRTIHFEDSIDFLHHPPKTISMDIFQLGKYSAQRRLILEELLAHNLYVLSIRKEIKKKAFSIKENCKLIRSFLNHLTITLTRSQKRALEDIQRDLSKKNPMIRLLQGDVGTGKTIVAALASFFVISSGKQVALMVPTELLANQHTKNFSRWFSPFNIKIGCFLGNQTVKYKNQQRLDVLSGKIKMIIGTHTLFQKEIHFEKLALIIIDEQQRFGVKQRFSFLKKGLFLDYHPHQLIMSATPIPRTLSMVLYSGLVDISILKDFPPGRQVIQTSIMPSRKRDDLIKRIREICLSKKNQIYWVCPTIEKPSKSRMQSAKFIYEELKLKLPNISTRLIHGKINTKKKQNLIENFRNGKIQILVATSIIEVGIDVPNANIMIIENSERIGLSQLHQLRGRIGRGTLKSYCILLYELPINNIAKIRLNKIKEKKDGFSISEEDLRIRGSGELLGTKQSGKMKFKIVELPRDQNLILIAQRIARKIHNFYPYLENPIIDRWLSKRKHFYFI